MTPEQSNALFRKLGSLETTVNSLNGDVKEIKAHILAEKLKWAKLGGIVTATSAIGSFAGWIIGHWK